MLIRASVADELASGRLVALSLDGPPMTAELVAAFQSRPVISPLVREFIQFVRDDLSTDRDSGGAAGRRTTRAAQKRDRR